MKLGIEHFGTLVRPRVITHTFVFETAIPIEIEDWWQKVHYLYKYRSIFQAEQVTETFDKPLEEIFSEMSFGDLSTTSNYSSSYVGKIVGFIVLCRNQYFFIDSKEKFKSLENKPDNKNNVHIISAAVRFYKGFSADPETNQNIVLEQDICDNSKEHIWFYCRQHLLPLEHLIHFESIKVGELVSTKNRSYLALEISQPNKPSFYKTGSWSSKVIKVLCCNNSLVVKFFPNKKFSVSRFPSE